jgi:hypothetical protein
VKHKEIKAALADPATEPDHLDSLVEAALDAGRDGRAGWSGRTDGWTPQRIGTFLVVLSRCGVVADAARAAGLSRKSAYALRNSVKGRAFAIAWNIAMQTARRKEMGALRSRVLDGRVDLIVRDGKVWGKRYRCDNRVAMAALTRLDRQVEAIPRSSHAAVQIVAQNFGPFVDALCAGNQAATQFIRSRLGTEEGNDEWI